MSNCCWESRGGSWGALCLKLEAFLEEALMLALLLLHLARWLSNAHYNEIKGTFLGIPPMRR
eukprot:scaffold162593_cov20-Tisochrysis_lutea.AAC.1